MTIAILIATAAIAAAELGILRGRRQALRARIVDRLERIAADYDDARIARRLATYA